MVSVKIEGIANGLLATVSCIYGLTTHYFADAERLKVGLPELIDEALRERADLRGQKAGTLNGGGDVGREAAADRPGDRAEAVRDGG